MKEKFLNYSMYKIQKSNNFDDTKLEELRYGLETFYMLCTKMIILIIISLILKLTQELLIFLLFFSPLRGFGFGFHAKNNVQCWLITIPLFIIIPLLIAYTKFSILTILIVNCFSLISFIFFAPADTENKPLINPKKRKVDKILIIIVNIFYFILCLIFKNQIIINAICFALIWQAVCVNPLIYLLFGQSYNNYKSYLNEV